MREQKSGPDLHVFTLNFLAPKKWFSWGQKKNLKIFYKEGIMQLFSVGAVVFSKKIGKKIDLEKVKKQFF